MKCCSFTTTTHANSSESGKDCYTVDGKPPRLADHVPDEFLLCFSHDRLDQHRGGSVPHEGR